MKKYNFIDKIIVGRGELIKMSHRLGSEIEKFYDDQNELVIITVLNGGLNFSQSIFNSNHFHPSFSYSLSMYYIRVESYGDDTKYSGKVKFSMNGEEITDWQKNHLLDSIKYKHVLIVDDIYDSGKTISELVKFLGDVPASVEICVMINRYCERVEDFHVLFVGKSIDIPDFLVGAGLDWAGQYRDLPYIGTLKSDFEGEHYEEYVCNECGELCTSKEEIKGMMRQGRKPSYYGLLDTRVTGGYYSPALSDCTAYEFDLCEACLLQLFSGFKYQVNKSACSPWE